MAWLGQDASRGLAKNTANRIGGIMRQLGFKHVRQRVPGMETIPTVWVLAVMHDVEPNGGMPSAIVPFVPNVPNGTQRDDDDDVPF